MLYTIYAGGPEAGDRRELVHLEQWRLVSPKMMAEEVYSKKIGLRQIKEFVDGFSPRVPEPPCPCCWSGWRWWDRLGCRRGSLGQSAY